LWTVRALFMASMTGNVSVRIRFTLK